MSDQQHDSFSERLEVAGDQLADKVRDLLAQGNVRTLTIRSETGELYLSVPLTAGVIAGGVFVLTAPWLVLIAAIAGLLAKVQLDVTYVGEVEQPGTTESTGTDAS